MLWTNRTTGSATVRKMAGLSGLHMFLHTLASILQSRKLFYIERRNVPEKEDYSKKIRKVDQRSKVNTIILALNKNE